MKRFATCPWTARAGLVLVLAGVGWVPLACRDSPPESAPPLSSAELPVAPPFALGARAASNSAGGSGTSAEEGSEEHGLEQDDAPGHEEDLSEEQDADSGSVPPTFAVPDGTDEVPL